MKPVSAAAPPVHRPSLGRHQMSSDGLLLEASSEYEPGDECVFPDKPVVILGQVVGV